MKKIGIIYGMEQSFPPALCEKINDKGKNAVVAEIMKIGAGLLDIIPEYDLIFDRASQEVPFYSSMLKAAALKGIKVVNNPFRKCADDNFFHAVMANMNGIKVPRTALLPSKEHPPGASSESLKNLQYPLDWDEIFDYVGWPAVLKPNKGNGSFISYKVYNPNEFFAAYDLTGNKVMILQEAIDYKKYFRCYVIGGRKVRIMEYEPARPHHMRYKPGEADISPDLKDRISETCTQVSQKLGFDFNAVEFALSGNDLYAMDFLNPQPNAEQAFLKDENFGWLVSKTADFLILQALEERKEKEIF